MTTFEYKGHLVIISKQRGLQAYDITIQNQTDKKIVKTFKDVIAPLRKARSRAKDWIGLI